MHNLTKKTKAIIAIATVAGLAGTGAAYAYWTVNGAGSSSASTGTLVPITVNMAPLTGLYPGGSVALGGTFTNTNPGSVYVTSVTAVLGSMPGSCLATDFSITGTATVANPNVPNGTGVGSWSGLTLTMSNSSISQDSCKLATIPLTLASS